MAQEFFAFTEEDAYKPDDDELAFHVGFSAGGVNGVLLVGTLNALAKKAAHGIIDFETYADSPEQYEGWLVYDKSNMKVACDMCVDELHRDIVSYYDFFFGANIHVIDEDEEPFVEVTLPGGIIVVDSGRWYVADFI